MLDMYVFHHRLIAASREETFLHALADLARTRLAELRARLDGARDNWVIW